MNQQKKEGLILEAYFVPGWGRSFIINEFKSGEEAAKHFSLLPLFSLMDIEIYPLADFRESIEGMIQSLKAAEKMMSKSTK